MEHVLQSPFSRLTRRVGIVCAALGLAFVAASARAEVVEFPSDYGYVITGLGAGQDEVALVFTNTAYTSESPMTWSLPDGVKTIQYLVVAGGASGASSGNAYATGGGGAGGVLTNTSPYSVSANATLSVVVGAGGAARTYVSSGLNGSDGKDSSLTISGVLVAKALKGGGGATGNGVAGKGGTGYGCGGGGSSYTKKGAGGVGTQGGNGAEGPGGGGGAGASAVGRNGGDGVAVTIFNDEECWIAGGGGASKCNAYSDGGKGGGGKGAARSAASSGAYYATSGSAWGAGGGGTERAYSLTSGAGYQGVVVVRYRVVVGQEALVPAIECKSYNGQPQTADVTDGEGYYVVENAGGTDAGDYIVTLMPSNGWHWTGGSTDPTNLTFTITKINNVWTTEPSLSKTQWTLEEGPATLDGGSAANGDVVVTYDEGLAEMPLTVGAHTAVFTVAASQNYNELKKTIAYTVSKNANAWTTTPAITPTTWELDQEPGVVTCGEAKFGGSAVITYDGIDQEMPTTLGQHTAAFTVPESDEYTGLSKTITYTVNKNTNVWTSEPKLSKTEWAFDQDPAEVTMGVAKYGDCTLTWDGDAEITEMPTALGNHTATFAVAETETCTALNTVINYAVTKRVNKWETEPVVPASYNIEDPAPSFGAPTSTYGDVGRYFDGDPSKTDVPTDLGSHTVTYWVEEGQEYQGYEKTYAFAVTYKPIVDRQDPSKVYGYRIPKLGAGQNEVALIFTNTAYTAEMPMVYRLPQYVTEVSYLVVGGGAGGGGGADGVATGRGGGGAGGVLTGDVWTVSGDMSIVVGKGGAGMSSSASAGWGGDGGMSLAANGEITMQAYGGGGGGSYNAGKGGEGYGCGGGGGTKVISSKYVGQAGGEAGQGFAGGASGNSTYLGGGGGGAGEAGYDSTSEHPGHGGKGIVSSITGEETWYAGGGGGSKASNAEPKTQSKGGQGGGGNGGYAASNQNSAGADASYFGGGGGGGHKTARGGNGYQGLVVVRYEEDAQAVTVPNVAPKVYSGELQVADLSDGVGYTVTANEGGTDVGEYSVTLTLVAGYHWDDGSTEPTNLVFAITQAQNEWTVEPSISKENWLTTDEPGVLTNGLTKFGEVTRVIVKDGGSVEPFVSLPTAAGVYVITNIAPATTANYLAPEVTEKTVAFTIFGASETPDFTVAFDGDVSVGVNENAVTAAIPYRVSCDVESSKRVNIHALITLEGESQTNDVTLAEGVSLEASGYGTLNDLKPGAVYDVALYGIGVDDGKLSSITDFVRVTTPGPATALTASATFTNDPKEFVISGSVTPGIGTTTVYLRWSLNSAALDNLATYTFVYGDEGAFSTNIAYTAHSDSLTWDVAVSNDFTSTTYGKFAWDDARAATTKTRVDTVATTYTWTGNGGDNLWTNAANWTANRTESYGYPDNSSYATAKFTMAVTVDLDGGTFKLVESGVVVSSNLGEVRLCNGAIDVPYKDFAYGASGTTIVFDSVTIKGQKGLKFVGNSPTVFSGDTVQEWIYEPWDTKNTKMIVQNGRMSSGFFQTYIDDSARRHVVDITNAVWTIRSKSGSSKYLSSPAIVMTLLDGADHQAQFVSLVEMSLGKTWSIAIPERCHALPSIQAPTLHADTDSCKFEVNVSDYTSGKKVPLVKFTGADQSETMASKLERTTLVAKARNKSGNLVDVTQERNARLVWSQSDNTLYYKQDGQRGFMIFVK